MNLSGVQRGGTSDNEFEYEVFPAGRRYITRLELYGVAGYVRYYHLSLLNTLTLRFTFTLYGLKDCAQTTYV